MFIQIVTFLTIMHLILAQYYNSIHSKFSDDAILDNILNRLDQLMIRIDATEENIQKSLQNLRAELLTKPIGKKYSGQNLKAELFRTKCTKEDCTISCRHFDDICADIAEQCPNPDRITVATSSKTTKSTPTRTFVTRTDPTSSKTTESTPTRTFVTRTNPTAATSPRLQPKNCGEAVRMGGKSGVYTIYPPEYRRGSPLEAYCQLNGNKEIDGDDRSAWLLIQRRYNGSENFFRSFGAYRSGFGSMSGEFFFGLDWILLHTDVKKYLLWIQFVDWDGATRYAKYTDFSIGSKEDGFYLKSLGVYSGDAGDSLSGHLNHKWSTYNRDNDNILSVKCAHKHHGGWWYGETKSSTCADSNLNGNYLVGDVTPIIRGIYWLKWRGYGYSYKYVHMAIRPVNWWDV